MWTWRLNLQLNYMLFPNSTRTLWWRPRFKSELELLQVLLLLESLARQNMLMIVRFYFVDYFILFFIFYSILYLCLLGWSDTTNTASRMESNGWSGYLQASPASYELSSYKNYFKKRGVFLLLGCFSPFSFGIYCMLQRIWTLKVKASWTCMFWS